eukprot:GILK01007313.1.p1 GENE.GILK01007313.1~~GILK01007313.1.p1  ORF type:complete len:404 (-),score=56.62 GILK01007313.1:117-1328(-)
MAEFDYQRTELSNSQVSRFSRQLLLPELGVQGQVNISKKSVLVIGAGGLGAPICLYLASSGIRRLGIVDADIVDTSNLHRQVIHSESRVGMNKAESACVSVCALNTDIECIAFPTRFTSENAMELAMEYDILVDATDNVESRYLINDTAILLKKPLVSGSALRWEGQITVYGYKGGPCYRCLFPSPPPAATVTNCDDGGVLGPVTGVIGSLQSLEVLKIAADVDSTTAGVLSQRLLLFDGRDCTFRNVKLRGRNKNCAVCGDEPTVTTLVDYHLFCSSRQPSARTVDPKHEITVTEYAQILRDAKDHILLDVRESIQFDICSLPNSISIPLANLSKQMDQVVEAAGFNEGVNTHKSVYVVCRRGNDSKEALFKLLEHGFTDVHHIEGGLQAWHHRVDPSFPLY